jgi:hypothetical protein
MSDHRAFLFPVALSMALLSTGLRAQTADTAASIAYPTVAAARSALEAMDGNGAIVTHPEGWMIANEPLASAQWSFTPEGHYAYPAVVRRTVKRDAGGAVSVETASLCEAGADACARLLTEFASLNDRVSQSIRAKARQGSMQSTR